MAEKLELYASGINRLKELSDVHTTLKQSSNQHTKLLKQAIAQGDFSEFSTFGSLVQCEACTVAATLLNEAVSSVTIDEDVEKVLVYVCSFILDQTSCQGFVDTLADIVIDNLLALPLVPDYLCSYYIKACTHSSYVIQDPQVFINNMLKDKPSFLEQGDFVDNLYEQIKNDPNRSSRKTLKMVQFTDLHMDLDYVAGSAAECDDVICCRARYGFPTDQSKQAGRMGSYECDVPLDVLTALGDFINQEINPDVIFWTGDSVPHDQYEYSLEYVTKYQERLTEFMKANLSSYSIYPLEGNHDFGVANSQNFTEPDPILAINLGLWSEYLDQQAQEVYALNGYYSQKLKLKDGTNFDNVNIVAINSMPCYQFNFYLWGERDDPGGVLAWLNKTLHEIEAKGEIAIFISHHPPGDNSCLYDWSVRYKAICDRFQHIIRYSIYGHVHREKHNLVTNFKNQSIGVQYWTGSATTFTFNNPTFRLYEVDVQTMLPIKVTTFVLPIQDPNPQWRFDHELTELYGMEDLSPKSFKSLSQKLFDDEQTAVAYLNAQRGNAPPSSVSQCDDDCRQQVYCQTSNNVYFEIKDCLGRSRMDIKHDFMNTFLELMCDPWVTYKHK